MDIAKASNLVIAPNSRWSTILGSLVAGGVGTAFQYLILILLVESFNVNAVLASAIGAFVGAIVNFILNHRFTFGGRRSWRSTSQRYVIATLLILLFNIAAMSLLVEIMRTDYRIAQITSTVLAFFVSYLLNDFWVFKNDGKRKLKS